MGFMEHYLYAWNHDRKQSAEAIFEGIAAGRKKALDDWFQEKWLKMEITEKEVAAAIENETEALSLFLSELLQDDSEGLEYFLLTEDGKVTASSCQHHIGMDYSYLPNIEKGKAGEAYMYGPYLDDATLDLPVGDRRFHDEVTLLFSMPVQTQGVWYLLCVRYLNDDMSNVIQEEDTHVWKESGDNYLFMIKNSRGIPVGTAISRSRFEDASFTHGSNLKDGIATRKWGQVQIKKHTEFEIIFTDPVTGKLHEGVLATASNGSNLNCWPGYPDYRHVLVGGKGVEIHPPHSEEVWGMMCEGDLREIYRFHKLHRFLPVQILGFGILGMAAGSVMENAGFPQIAGKFTEAAVLFAGSMFSIRMMLHKPLKKTAKLMNSIAEGEGDLTRRLHISGKNEISEIAVWFNKFISTQMQMIDRVSVSAKSSKRTVKQVAHASRRIACHVEDIGKKLEILSHNTVTQNGLFLDMEREITKITDSFEKNRHMEEMIHEIQKKTKDESSKYDAEKLTEEVLESIQRLEDTVKNSVSAIRLLEEKSEQITEIVSTIAEISRETNLLALNAEIEAARAGEAGKGFSVVANEIKELSQNTHDATQNIGQLISEIQQDVNETNTCMELIYENVESSNSLTRKGVEAMRLVTNVSHAISDVYENMKEQNDRIGHVKEQMEDMSKKSADAVREGEQGREDAQKKMAEIARQMRNLNKVVEGLQFASMAEESMVNSFLTVNNKKAKDRHD